MAERDRAVGGRAERRLRVLPGARAGRRVAAVADREVALQRGQRGLVEDLRDQAHVLVDQDLAAVADRDARPTPGRGAGARRDRSRSAWRRPRRVPRPRTRRRRPGDPGRAGRGPRSACRRHPCGGWFGRARSESRAGYRAVTHFRARRGRSWPLPPVERRPPYHEPTTTRRRGPMARETPAEPTDERTALVGRCVARRAPADRRGRHPAGRLRDRRDQRGPRGRHARVGGGRGQRRRRGPSSRAPARPWTGCSQELAKADDWGLLRFVPHERLDPSAGETWGWVPDIEPIDDAPTPGTRSTC